MINHALHDDEEIMMLSLYAAVVQRVKLLVTSPIGNDTARERARDPSALKTLGDARFF